MPRAAPSSSAFNEGRRWEAACEAGLPPAVSARQARPARECPAAGRSAPRAVRPVVDGGAAQARADWVWEYRVHGRKRWPTRQRTGGLASGDGLLTVRGDESLRLLQGVDGCHFVGKARARLALPLQKDLPQPRQNTTCAAALPSRPRACTGATAWSRRVRAPAVRPGSRGRWPVVPQASRASCPAAGAWRVCLAPPKAKLDCAQVRWSWAVVRRWVFGRNRPAGRGTSWPPQRQATCGR